MAEQQLQMGELERMDGMGNPVPALPTPADVSQREEDERKLYGDSIAAELPVIEDEPLTEEEMFAPLEGPMPTDEIGERADPDPERLMGAAEILRAATKDRSINEQSVLDMLHQQTGGEVTRAALAQLELANGGARRDQLLSALTNPALTVDSKLALIQQMDQLGSFDANAVDRSYIREAQQQDQQDDSGLPDQEQWNQHVQNLTNTSQPDVESPEAASYGAYTKTALQELQEAYKEANGNIGLLDIAEQLPMGALPTLNRAVSNIYKDLNMSGGLEQAMSYGAVGEALADLRNTIKQMNPEQRDNAMRVVMKNLKQHSGLVQDSNDLVTVQVLDNLFSKELTGRDEYAFENSGGSLTPAQQEELRRLNQKLALDPRGGSSEDRARQQELVNQAQGFGPGRMLDNIFNLMDWAPFAGAASKTIKFGPKIATRMWGKLFRQAPEAGAKIAAEAAADPALAARMGMTQGQVIELGLPSARTNAEASQQGTNIFDRWMAEQADNTDTKLRMAQPHNLTQAEAEKAYQEIAGDWDILLSRPKPKLHLNQSNIALAEDGNSAEIEAVFGMTSQRGWAQLGNARKAAKDAAEEVFGVDANVEIVARNEKTGMLEVVDPSTPDTTIGEFYQRVKDTRHLESAGNTFGALQFADDTVDNMVLGEAVSSWTRGANIFNDFTLDKISTRATQHKALQASFLSDFSKITALPASKQQKLSKVIIESEGRVLDGRELEIAFKGDQKLMKAYTDFRRIDDTMYALEDRAVRNAYLREGLSDIRYDGKRLGWGKRVDNAEEVLGKNVWDPDKGEMVRMSKARWEFETRLNGSFAKMKYDIHGSSESASYVLLRHGKSRVLPIPQSGVLPRIPGHYPHMFTYNHLVRARMKDGSIRAVAGALDKTTAARHLTRLQARKKPANVESYFLDVDSPLRQADAYGSSIDELSINRGGVLFGKRNDGKIRNLNKRDHVAEYDPIAALLRGTEIMSTKATKGDLTQSMRVRLHNYLQTPEAREVLPPMARNKGAMQLTLDDFPNAPPRTPGDKAKAYMRQIDLMERSPDAWSQLQKGAYRQMSHFAYMLAERLGMKDGPLVALDRFASNQAREGQSYVGKAMGLIHNLYISMAVPKQLAYQIMQTSVPLSMHPIQFAKSLRQVGPLAMLVSFRLNALHSKGVGKLFSMEARKVAPFAKAMGVSTQEAMDLTELVVKNGIIDAVSHNVAIKDAIGEAAQRTAERNARGPASALGRLIESGREAMGPLGQLTRARTWSQATFGKMSKYGFEAGENANQLMTLLTLYNADKAAGKAALKSSAYADDLIGRTRELTGNMIKEATPGYARSVLKPILQWVPFQHKMILLMLPDALGGAARFSGKDKAAIALGQFLIYGASGGAVFGIAKSIIEKEVVESIEGDPNADKLRAGFAEMWRDPLTRKAMDGFLADYIGNNVMKAIYGEDDPERPGEFAWGKAFAPGSGYGFIGDKIQAVAALDTDELLGVTGDYASRVGQFAQLVRQVATANLKQMDAVPLNQRVEMVLKQGAIDLIPMYGKYVTAQWALANENYISQGGQLGDGFNSEIEVILSQQFGVETKDRASFIEARDRLADKMADPKERDAELRKVADTYWRRLVTQSVKAEAEAPTDEMYHQLMQQHLLNDSLVLSTLDPLDREKFNELIARKLDTVYKGNGDSSEKAFIEKQAQILEQGGYGSDGPNIANYLRNLSFVQQNPQYSTMIEQAWMRIMQEQQAEGLRPTDEETQ